MSDNTMAKEVIVPGKGSATGVLDGPRPEQSVFGQRLDTPGMEIAPAEVQNPSPQAEYNLLRAEDNPVVSDGQVRAYLQSKVQGYEAKEQALESKREDIAYELAIYGRTKKRITPRQLLQIEKLTKRKESLQRLLSGGYTTPRTYEELKTIQEQRADDAEAAQRVMDADRLVRAKRMKKERLPTYLAEEEKLDEEAGQTRKNEERMKAASKKIRMLAHQDQEIQEKTALRNKLDAYYDPAVRVREIERFIQENPQQTEAVRASGDITGFGVKEKKRGQSHEVVDEDELKRLIAAQTELNAMLGTATPKPAESVPMVDSILPATGEGTGNLTQAEESTAAEVKQEPQTVPENGQNATTSGVAGPSTPSDGGIVPLETLTVGDEAMEPLQKTREYVRKQGNVTTVLSEFGDKTSSIELPVIEDRQVKQFVPDQPNTSAQTGAAVSSLPDITHGKIDEVTPPSEPKEKEDDQLLPASGQELVEVEAENVVPDDVASSRNMPVESAPLQKETEGAHAGSVAEQMNPITATDAATEEEPAPPLLHMAASQTVSETASTTAEADEANVTQGSPATVDQVSQVQEEDLPNPVVAAPVKVNPVQQPQKKKKWSRRGVLFKVLAPAAATAAVASVAGPVVLQETGMWEKAWNWITSKTEYQISAKNTYKPKVQQTQPDPENEPQQLTPDQEKEALYSGWAQLAYDSGMQSFFVSNYNLFCKQFPHPTNFNAFLTIDRNYQHAIASGCVNTMREVFGDIYLPDAENVRDGFERYWVEEKQSYDTRAMIVGILPDRPYTDDNGWDGRELQRALDYTTDPAIRSHIIKRKKQIYRLGERNWAADVGGGTWWLDQQNAPNDFGKNRGTLSDALLSQNAIDLCLNAQQEGNGQDAAKYLASGIKHYEWVRATTSDGHGIYRNSLGDDRKYTYIQGVMIGAGIKLFQATGEREYLKQARDTALASLSYFANQYDSQSMQFNAVFFEELVALANLIDDRDLSNRVESTLESQAESLWNNPAYHVQVTDKYGNIKHMFHHSEDDDPRKFNSSTQMSITETFALAAQMKKLKNAATSQSIRRHGHEISLNS